MAEERQEEEGKVPVEIASNIVQLAAFLDPHLPAAPKAVTSDRRERWPRHKAIAFIITVSLILWVGGIIRSVAALALALGAST